MKLFITSALVAAALFVLPAEATVAQRILSLDLCTDWMLARYAAPAQVVALSSMHRQFPVDWLAPNWPTHDGALESIVELKPDLVITGQYNARLLRNRLKALGFRVEVLELPTSLEAVEHYEQHFLRLLGKPITLATAPLEPVTSNKPPKRLLLLGANGIGTGRGTFEDAILQRAGWSNYLLEDGYLRLDLEQLVINPPDAILWAAPEHRALANRFAEHPVLRRSLSAQHWLSTNYWRWQCPGPWTWEIVGELQRWHE